MNEPVVRPLAAAYALLHAGRPAAALELAEQHFDAEDPSFWHVRSAALLALDRHEEAARAAEEGLAVDAEEPMLLDALAAARLNLGDCAGAEEAILKALRIDAYDAQLLTRYAHVVARAGQLAKAEKLVMRALSIDPEDEYALNIHALLAAAGSDDAATAARTRELLRVSPESAFAHRLLGATHARDGRVEPAFDHLSRAVRLDPANDDAAGVAREARALSHWSLWPLRPVVRFGAAPVWLTVIGGVLLLRVLRLETAASVLLVAWVVYCVYSWIAPPLVRRMLRRR